jgi:hypothetical protein
MVDSRDRSSVDVVIDGMKTGMSLRRCDVEPFSIPSLNTVSVYSLIVGAIYHFVLQSALLA